ncbi:MAG: hypothetical protein J6T58_06845 [Bacteroidales bacterium]|nr:hypothetical protein [Bacteroidales bacterium]
MELKPNKDWTDAIREKYLSELPESTPAVGWEAIGRRLHRRTVLRRSAVAAAILLPFTALLIWSPWHNAVPALESPVAIVEEAPSVPDADEEPTVAPDSTAIRNALQQAEKPVFIAQPEQSPVADDLSLEQQLPSAPSADTETAIPDSSATNTQGPSEQPAPRQIRELVPDDFLAFAEPEPRPERKVALGISAGSAAIQRDNWFNSISAPYFAKLAYINIAPELEQQGKISIENINDHFNDFLLTKASKSSFMPNPSTPSEVYYRHDLPLSFGLMARLGLLPWLGVESGVEYTYLHSVADSYLSSLDQRLHFIGIPVRLDASLWSNHSFEIYAALGGKAEKCVSATLGQVRCDEPRIQLSAEVAGGIQYRLWDHIHLYLQPELTWYMTKTDLITYRTENPLGFSFDAGLRFEL